MIAGRRKLVLIVLVLGIVMALVWVMRSRPQAPVVEPVNNLSSLSVEVTRAQWRPWPDELTASGRLLPWQEALISAETGSLRIASINADIGDRVRKGQVLATLAQDSLLAEQSRQQATVEQAKANLQKAQSDVRRAEVVGVTGVLSAQQSEQYRIALATAKAELGVATADMQSIRIRLGQTRIVAVDDGIISSRTALLGNVVNAGTELFRLVREGRIEWQAELDARQLLQVKPGQHAQLTLPDGQSVAGQVRLLSPILDNNTGRALVYVALESGSAARSGMYASGRIELPARPALTVPDTAVFLRDGRSWVFTVGADERVAQRQVQVGRRRDNAVEIVSGLDERQTIVRSGGAFLSDGVHVTPVTAGSVQP
ncbi:secretion protein HlyD [Pseudomonas cichorii]|nr:secretion protein HlyD [Pseudomonas cichorii]